MRPTNKLPGKQPRRSRAQREIIDWLREIVVKRTSAIASLVASLPADNRELLQEPLATLGLPVRTANVLEEAGVNTVLDVLVCYSHELERLPNVGEKTVEEIVAVLKTHGLVATESAQALLLQQRRMEISNYFNAGTHAGTNTKTRRNSQAKAAGGTGRRH